MAKFSSNGEFVYCFSSTKNLYIFDRKTGKLLSLMLIPTSKPEISGMVVGSEESMVIYDFGELFKLDPNV